jgi:homoserine dehydrogenase
MPAEAAPARPALRLDLLLVGFGHVGTRFARLLDDLAPRLVESRGLATRIVGVATARHGAALAPAGLDPATLVARRAAGLDLGALHDAATGPPPRDGLEFIARAAALPTTADARVLVEATTLEPRTGRPALDHVRAALEAGLDVVTVNKGPAAVACRDLRELARRRGVEFLFEGAVMDGIPVFNLVRETLPAVRVLGFRGVVNSTTNYVITALEEGRTAAEAIAEMQAAGIAEADPSLDLEGWDAAAKVAVLANALMDADLTPDAVPREGIADLTAGRVQEAVARGARIRLVAQARREGSRIESRVAPTELPAGDLLATLRGTANALVLETDVLGELAVVQPRGSLEQTAYALVTDLASLSRRLRAPRPARADRTP